MLPIFLQAVTTSIPLENPTHYQEQKKIYDTQSKKKKIHEKSYSELNVIPIKEDTNASTASIRIDEFILENSELINDNEFNILIKPYLNRCDTMQDSNTVVKKINNIYIEKAYVTSRAYIKA